VDNQLSKPGDTITTVESGVLLVPCVPKSSNTPVEVDQTMPIDATVSSDQTPDSDMVINPLHQAKQEKKLDEKHEVKFTNSY
jgi:hypothetical protein